MDVFDGVDLIAVKSRFGEVRESFFALPGLDTATLYPSGVASLECPGVIFSAAAAMIASRPEESALFSSSFTKNKQIMYNNIIKEENNKYI